MTEHAVDEIGDLLFSTYGADDPVEYSQVRLPHPVSEAFVDLEQADLDEAREESEILDGRHVHSSMPSSITSPQSYSSNIDPALLNPSIYQTQFARADPRFAHLDTGRTIVLTVDDPHTLQMLRGVHDGNLGFGSSATQARQESIVWDGCGNVIAGHISSQTLAAHDVSFHDNGGDFLHAPAQNLVLDVAIRHQQDRTHVSEPLCPLVQQNASEWIGCTLACPPFCSPEMHAASQQSRSVHRSMTDAGPASIGMDDHLDSDSHGPEAVLSHSDPDPSGIQSQVRTAAPAKSLVCPICKRQLRDRPGLRYDSRYVSKRTKS